MSNKFDEKLFEKIFDPTLIKLTDKLINTTSKEKNQIIVNSIKKNKNKIFQRGDFSDWLIKPNNQHFNLLDTIDLLLSFNKTTQLDLIWGQSHWGSIEIKISELFLIEKTLTIIDNFM